MPELLHHPVGFIKGPAGPEAAFCAQAMLLLRGQLLWPEDIPVASPSDEINWLLDNGFFVKRIGNTCVQSVILENVMYVEDDTPVTHEDMEQTFLNGGIVRASRNYGKTSTLIFDGTASSADGMIGSYYSLYEPLPSYKNDAVDAFRDIYVSDLNSQGLFQQPTLHISDPEHYQ